MVSVRELEGGQVSCFSGGAAKRVADESKTDERREKKGEREE